MKTKKIRLDQELVRRELVPSIEKAQAIIMAGEVLVDNQIVYKSDKKVEETTDITIKKRYPYVSRGGLKIASAFETFGVSLKNARLLDVGISTGGFTDFALKNGAETAAGVDVNIEQVAWELRNSPKLTLIKKNARDLMPADIPFSPTLIVMDLSFISILKVLPALSDFTEAEIVTLVKPQFEARRDQVGKGGIVRKTEDRIDIVLSLKEQIIEMGYTVQGFTTAGIKGQKGNQEYFFYLRYNNGESISDQEIIDEIKL